MRDAAGGLDLGGGRGGVRWGQSLDVLKVEPKGFSGPPYISVRERGVEMTLRSFDPHRHPTKSQIFSLSDIPRSLASISK